MKGIQKTYAALRCLRPVFLRRLIRAARDPQERTWLVFCALLIAVFFSVAAPLAFSGPFNPDEGVYLYASWRAASGEVPYLDFAFIQPPLILYAHGAFQRLLGPDLELGKLVNASMGVVVILATMHLTRYVGGSFAGIVAGALLAALPWFVLQATTVSTFMLAAIFLISTLAAALARHWVLAGILTVATVWTRLPLLPLAPVIAAAAVFQPPRLKALIRFVAGAVLAASTLVAPFVAFLGDHIVVSLVGHYQAIHQSALANLLGFVDVDYILNRILHYERTEYLPLYGWLWLLSAASVILLLFSRRQSVSPTKKEAAVLGAAVIVGIATPQALFKNVTHDVPLIPLFALLIGVGVTDLFTRLHLPKRRDGLARAFVLTVVVLGAALHQRATLSASGDHEESRSSVRRVAQYIRLRSAPNDAIFTPETYIAIEAHLKTLPRTELGRFFFFPELSTETAEKMRVATRELFPALIEEHRPRFVVFNQNLWWRHAPYTEANREKFRVWLTSLGYRPADELHERVPSVENLRVYEHGPTVR